MSTLAVYGRPQRRILRKSLRLDCDRDRSNAQMSSRCKKESCVRTLRNDNQLDRGHRRFSPTKKCNRFYRYGRHFYDAVSVIVHKMNGLTSHLVFGNSAGSSRELLHGGATHCAHGSRHGRRAITSTASCLCGPKGYALLRNRGPF